ncbi:MAG: hypothetical protein ABII07_03190 [Patescibacteria group bacterium]|nr:hypothetical protein [Patescibacteria group bacterium]
MAETPTSEESVSSPANAILFTGTMVDGTHFSGCNTERGNTMSMPIGNTGRILTVTTPHDQKEVPITESPVERLEDVPEKTRASFGERIMKKLYKILAKEL